MTYFVTKAEILQEWARLVELGITGPVHQELVGILDEARERQLVVGWSPASELLLDSAKTESGRLWTATAFSGTVIRKDRAKRGQGSCRNKVKGALGRGRVMLTF